MNVKKIKDPDVKQEWVEALRSGRYEQGTGGLRTESGAYCCLGVLCDVLARRDPDHVMWSGNFVVTEFVDEDGATKQHTDDGVLPEYVCDLLGIDDDPSVEVDDYEAGLINLNDDQGWTFEEIADIVEAQL